VDHPGLGDDFAAKRAAQPGLLAVHCFCFSRKCALIPVTTTPS